MSHRIERISLKSPSPGTERFLMVHRFGTPGARPRVYLQAALHADEWPGLMALNHLLPMLAAADRDGAITGEIVVLPYANPIGLDQRVGGAMPGRYSFDGSGNFNRNWPDLSHAAAQFIDDGFTGEADRDVAVMQDALVKAVATLSTRTEVDHWRAQVLAMSVGADYVIDVHCDQEALAHLYCHEAHAAIACDLAAAIDIPVVLLEDEAGGFSFDDCHAGVWRRMGGLVPGGDKLPMHGFSCTLELRGKDDVNDTLGHSDATGLLNFLIKRGVIAGTAEMAVDPPEPYRLDQVDVINSPISGLVAFKAEIGDVVATGDLIAEVIDLCAEDPLQARTELRARTSGLFFTRGDQRLVAPGEGVAKIAGRVPLAHRRKGALLED